MKLEVFKGRSGEWFVRLVARNGQTVVVTEGYTRKASAIRSARSLRTGVATAEIEVV